MKQVDQKLIEAIKKKAWKICPDSLALIGIYGSVATGDDTEKSDLDLLILINDEKGWQLADAFILDDREVGYDIYCTNWDMLEEDAKCRHAHLSKLLDAKIVYVKDEAAVEKLKGLRQQAADLLASQERCQRSAEAFLAAKGAFADCCLTDSLSEARTFAGYCINFLADSVMLYCGKYFRFGIKRTFEELRQLNLPFDMEKEILCVMRAESVEEIRGTLTCLLRSVREYLQFSREKKEGAFENLNGTYEEMYSNWRNKMFEAAEKGDLYASFMNLVSLQGMIHELAEEIAITDFEIMGEFSPANLSANTRLFDRSLERYLDEYKKRNMAVRHFADVDAYLKIVAKEQEEA